MINGYRIFPGDKGGRGVTLTTHHHLGVCGLLQGENLPFP